MRPHRPGRGGLHRRTAGAAHLLGPARRGHRPGLQDRQPRGPLRHLHLLPQGRHARLPAERGHGRPAERGAAAHEARNAHGRRSHPQQVDPLLQGPRQHLPADALPVLRGHRRGHRRGGQRAGGRSPHRGRAVVEVPVSRDPGRDRRLGDGGQSLPPAQDPLLDAHHRVEPRALRTVGGGPQRATPAGRRLHRRHRPLPARRHPLPQRRHQAHLLRREAAPARLPRVLQRRRRRRRAALGLDRTGRDLPAPRHVDALPPQAVARGIVEPPHRLLESGADLLGDPRHERAAALPLGQHPGGRRTGEGLGRRAARSAARVVAGACTD